MRKRKKMPQKKHYIEELFADALPIDEKEVVEALKPFVTIQRDSKGIHFKNYQNLTMEDRILAFGLAEKLLKLRGFIEEEKISASEFHRKTGFKKGSIDPAFKNLKGKFIIGKGKEYEIPNYRVNEIVKRLKNKFEKSKK